MTKIIAEFELITIPQEAAEHVFQQDMELKGYVNGIMIERGWNTDTDPHTSNPSKDIRATPLIRFIKIIK